MRRFVKKWRPYLHFHSKEMFLFQTDSHFLLFIHFILAPFHLADSQLPPTILMTIILPKAIKPALSIGLDIDKPSLTKPT